MIEPELDRDLKAISFNIDALREATLRVAWVGARQQATGLSRECVVNLVYYVMSGFGVLFTMLCRTILFAAAHVSQKPLEDMEEFSMDLPDIEACPQVTQQEDTYGSFPWAFYLPPGQWRNPETCEQGYYPCDFVPGTDDPPYPTNNGPGGGGTPIYPVEVHLCYGTGATLWTNSDPNATVPVEVTAQCSNEGGCITVFSDGSTTANCN